jgi:hypothetical protein
MTCVKTDFFNKSDTFLLLLSTSVIFKAIQLNQTTYKN